MNRPLPFHYGWLIVISGTLGSFACIGLAHFALGMLLPAMGEENSRMNSEMLCGQPSGILIY
ncbi:hypothetical protein [Desulfobulbus alkaliphilus]|uniref:hypothetical protein n=1 Tax=Desulfobulbus alkaliphilus TaxID=869814 RepID=UPI00196429A5|nr:hypothetical protein [Desulfobulbus alkaliphilus]MBM9537476.1 hypothetical protein [Desulfobulbus alkaliphilus]